MSINEKESRVEGAFVRTNNSLSGLAISILQVIKDLILEK